MFFLQTEDGIRDAQESRGLGDVYKKQMTLVVMNSLTKKKATTVTCFVHD